MSYKYTKKLIYNIAKELQKTIKNPIATEIAQKSCGALFPSWSFRENDMSKLKIKIQRGNVESFERNLII